MHPAVEQILRWFKSDHLPDDLGDYARAVEVVAKFAADTLDGPELTAGLRHLLEAKDCFVRAAIDARP